MTVLAKLVTVYTNDNKKVVSSFLYMFLLFKPRRLLFKCEVTSL